MLEKLFKIIKSKYARYAFWAFLVGFPIYVFVLHQQIVSKFEGRRWNLPSRIYSDSFPLYNGQSLTNSDLKERLKGLGYRKVAYQPKYHGQYTIQGSRAEIYLHQFEYPHHKFEGGLIAFDLVNNRIRSLSVLKGEFPKGTLIQLEPELIASIYDRKMEDRTFVKLEQIPKELKQGVILIEDERYYDHFGIDVMGILRAAFVNLTKGRIVQGGSTLTQQLVKNYFLHQRKTVLRKVNEIFMAIIMEMRYSKDEILQAYFNEVYFGQNASASLSGVAEAAKFYFSKEISQLQPAESALLAAIVKSPGLFSPTRHPERAKGRRDLILNRLHEHKVISKKQHQVALKTKLPKPIRRKWATHAPFFVELVKKQLKEHYSYDILSSEGMRIFTTLDMNKQRAAEKNLSKRLSDLEKKRSYLSKRAKAGNMLQGALVAIHPQTGFIEAYVGGRSFGKSQFDHVSLAKRQPGSVFKPFVFAAALDPNNHDDAAWTLSSVIPDEKLSFKTPEGKWTPKNYDKTYHGLVRLRESLEKSYNVSTTWLANEVGLEKVVDLAKDAGIKARLKPYPSLALGPFEVTPLEMVEAYSIFPNQGTRVFPISIRRVVTREGEVLEKKSFGSKRVISKEMSHLMNRLLQGVLDRGTATAARAYGFSKLAAGKTGTTSGYRDAWFVGYTPDHLALVWVGYDDNKPTNLSGASGALPIWADYMKSATSGRYYVDFPKSKNMIRLRIDKKTGLLYHRSCSEPIEEVFIEGTEPMIYCDESSI